MDMGELERAQDLFEDWFGSCFKDRMGGRQVDQSAVCECGVLSHLTL